MEIVPFLRLVLGLDEVADGAEAVGIALAALAQQDVGGPKVLLDALDTAQAGVRFRRSGSLCAPARLVTLNACTLGSWCFRGRMDG